MAMAAAEAAEDGRGEVKLISLGGKGLSLSSNSLYEIAIGRARLRIDSSALDRRVQNPPEQNPKQTTHFPIPQTLALTPIETRASLAVLLNKLLQSSNSPNVRPSVPDRIVGLLNSVPEAAPGLVGEPVEVTEEEKVVFDRSASYLYGLCGLLDYETTNLTVFADVVAALSCEVLKADVAVFDRMDSGDGSVDKNAVGVASDMKVLLNGSKMVGKVADKAISKIPKLHGTLREAAKSLHLMTRVELNSGIKGWDCGDGEAVAGVVNALAVALYHLGYNSLHRATMNLDAVVGLKEELLPTFEKNCPTKDFLLNVFMSASGAQFDHDYQRLVHEVNGLLGLVWSIVAWEGITAFVALEGGNLVGGKVVEGVELNGEDVKAEKKNEKKKKKAVLGKGNIVVVQLIKDRLLGKQGNSRVLEKWVEDLFLLFDPKGPDFDGFVVKMKEIVESNESRRLPKLPKVI